MDINELFDSCTKIIASPHKTITEHDKRRAVMIFIAIEEFLLDNLPAYELPGQYTFDFVDYTAKILDELEGKIK